MTAASPLLLSLRACIVLCKKKSSRPRFTALSFKITIANHGLRFRTSNLIVDPKCSHDTLRNDLCMSGSRASAPASTAKVFLRSNPIVDPKCSHATAQKCPFRHESPPCGAAVMSGVFRFVFLVRRCPICVILHIYHHAVAQYHIEKYGKHTADCT